MLHPKIALRLRRKPGWSGIFATVLCGLLFVAAPMAVRAQAPEAYKWSVQYLIDQSQSVFGRPQTYIPRHNRGLAISPDGRYLYAGYNRSAISAQSRSYKPSSRWQNAGEVRKIDLTYPDYEKATIKVLPGPRGKAIAVDDEGRVYIASVDSVFIFDADLYRMQCEIPVPGCEGLAVTREGGKLVLYGTERDRGTLDRWVLEKKGDEVVNARLEGLAEDGRLVITTALSLRGIAIDARGRIWIADLEGNKVYRVDNDGKNLVSVAVRTPMAIAFDGPKCFVTRYLEREISLIDESMNVTGTLSVPWEDLELSSQGNNLEGALSGIVIIKGGRGFYVANEGGQTANQKSTYGRPDEYTDFLNGKLYIDTIHDDNEPILRAIPVAAAPSN